MYALVLWCSLLATPASSPATGPADARPTVVIVVGAEGSSEFGPEFAKWADRWAAAGEKGSARVIQIGRGEASTRPAETDRERLRAALEMEVGPAGPAATQPAGATRPTTLATAATQPATRPTDPRPLWLVLIGHGTFDGRSAKFNLRGPDVSADELADWLRPCRRPLAVLDCTSGSAPFLNRLAGPGRVVVTATRSGQEVQYARFGAYLSAAVADPAADLDKDGQTSLLEAFLAAAHGTEAFYKENGRLATEHALLEDNGDALGTPATFFQGLRATRASKDGAALDGHRAHLWHLVLSPAELAMPADLRAKRDELELKVQDLRDRKAKLPEADYYRQLEPLLLDLARVYERAGTPGR